MPSDNRPQTGAELERRILAALEAAGGEGSKTAIRHDLHCSIPTAWYDQVLAGLVASGRVETRETRGVWTNNRPWGMQPNHAYTVTLYRLIKEPE